MQAEAGTPLTRPHPRRALWVFAVAGLWVVLDQITKAWAEASLTRGQPVPLVGDLLQLHLTYNSGAAFSLGTGSTQILTVFATVVSVVIAWQGLRTRSLPWALTLGLLLGGAVGNLVDRYFRPPGGPGSGHVVDFLALPNFPIFNIADIGVTTGAALIILLALRGYNLDGTREGRAQQQGGTPHTEDEAEPDQAAAAPEDRGR